MLESYPNHLLDPGHDSERRVARRLKLLLVVFLAALSIAYLAKGFYCGIFLNGEGSDVLRRWLEERFVLGEHTDPQVALHVEEWSIRRGPTSGLLMFWPPWTQVRAWFAVINFVSLIWIVRFVAGYARGQSKLDRILLVLSVIAIGATCTTIGVGNYPLIVVALLVGAYQAEQAGRPILSGLLMGMALLKPQV